MAPAEAALKGIMVTAVGQKPIVERCKKLGISGYITKPFDDAKITELVKNTINVPSCARVLSVEEKPSARMKR